MVYKVIDFISEPELPSSYWRHRHHQFAHRKDCAFREAQLISGAYHKLRIKGYQRCDMAHIIWVICGHVAPDHK